MEILHINILGKELSFNIRKTGDYWEVALPDELATRIEKEMNIKDLFCSKRNRKISQARYLYTIVKRKQGESIESLAKLFSVPQRTVYYWETEAMYLLLHSATFKELYNKVT